MCTKVSSPLSKLEITLLLQFLLRFVEFVCWFFCCCCCFFVVVFFVVFVFVVVFCLFVCLFVCCCFLFVCFLVCFFFCFFFFCLFFFFFLFVGVVFFCCCFGIFVVVVLFVLFFQKFLFPQWANVLSIQYESLSGSKASLNPFTRCLLICQSYRRLLGFITTFTIATFALVIESIGK